MAIVTVAGTFTAALLLASPIVTAAAAALLKEIVQVTDALLESDVFEQVSEILAAHLA